MSGQKNWTEGEVYLLKNNYSQNGFKYCCSLLKHRSENQIRWKVKHLGLKVDEVAFSRICRKSFGKIKELIDISKFENINDKKIAYILGMLWADGYINRPNRSIRLSLEKEDGESIKNILIETLPWLVYGIKSSNPKHKDSLLFVINDLCLFRFLTDNDYQIKSGASADKILSKIPEHLKHYWWRGYFDGDGYIKLKKHKTKPSKTYGMSLSSCYEQNWNFVLKLESQLNIKFKIRRDIQKSGGKGSHCIINRFDHLKIFFDYIYQGDQFGFKRKKDVFEEIILYKNQMAVQLQKCKTSKYKGVCLVKETGKYTSQYNKNRKQFHIGTFNDEESAYKALLNYKMKAEQTN